MQAGRLREPATRRMLVSFDTARVAARCSPGFALAPGRHFATRPASFPLVPYGQEEVERLHRPAGRPPISLSPGTGTR